MGIRELLEQIAISYGDRSAVKDTNGKHLSYAELHAVANRVARVIRSQTEIRPNTLIGLYINRSVDTVIAMLAILKAGAGFVPIDPQYPKKTR